MGDTTSGSENNNASISKEDSSFEMATSGGSSSKVRALKKGPWTAAEDAILVEYVNTHGEGNWNAVQRNTGLARCGKSCRLRWKNHLRPDLKKCPYTSEEENKIIELHAKIGNKWSQIATTLPGRTDNEIKNYWNTRLKRRHRTREPIYPPEIAQAVNETQQNHGMAMGQAGAKHCCDVSGTNGLDMAQMDFRIAGAKQCCDVSGTNGLGMTQMYFRIPELNQSLLSCPTDLCDLPVSYIRNGGVNLSPSFESMSSPHERCQGMVTPIVSSAGTTSNSFPSFGLYEDDSDGNISLAFWTSSPHDTDLNRSNPSAIYLVPGSHASLNGNFSSSEPILVDSKSELPSFQFSASQTGNWVTPSSLLPSPESADTLIQSLLSEQTQSYCPSPQSSGLLEDVVYESILLKKSKVSSHPQVSETSGIMESSSQNSEAKWEAYCDPTSPLGHHAISAFMEYTPFGGSLSDEPPSTEAMPGCEVTPKAANRVAAESGGKDTGPHQSKYLSPDVLLNSYC